MIVDKNMLKTLELLYSVCLTKPEETYVFNRPMDVYIIPGAAILLLGLLFLL